MRTINLNDLPKYLPSLANLLDAETCRFPKTETATHKEYDQDKWGWLLQNIRTQYLHISLENVNAMFSNGRRDIPCLVGDELVLMDYDAYYREYYRMVRERLKPHVSEGDTVVELGCGFGQICLNLMRQDWPMKLRWLAGDFSENGIELLRRIAEAEGLVVEAFLCNFYDPVLTSKDIPPGAVIFTSYALTYLSTIPEYFLDALTRLQPKAVIHFEPCYECYDPSTLLGLLGRRYIEVHDYAKNIAGYFQAQAKAGRIRLLELTPPVMGINPLLPQSILAWTPT